MIEYKLIGESIGFYENRGFSRVELPWLVTEEISSITTPEGASNYRVTRDGDSRTKIFVASAEQSFLYQINKGHLPTSGRFQSVTPCMRNEPFDETHVKYFMKNELIAYGNHYSRETLEEMVVDALQFFSNHVRDPSKLDTKSIGYKQIDIEYDGVEIGSYGMRECSFVKWVYGTGLAEPRFSKVKER